MRSADDVPLLISGPGSGYFAGIHNNTNPFFGIMAALEIDARVGTTPTQPGAGRLPDASSVLPSTSSNGGLVGIGLGSVLASLLMLGSPRATRHVRRLRGFEPARRIGRALRAARRSFGEALRDDQA